MNERLNIKRGVVKVLAVPNWFDLDHYAQEHHISRLSRDHQMIMMNITMAIMVKLLKA